jgi:hypothetical protein
MGGSRPAAGRRKAVKEFLLRRWAWTILRVVVAGVFIYAQGHEKMVSRGFTYILVGSEVVGVHTRNLFAFPRHIFPKTEYFFDVIGVDIRC